MIWHDHVCADPCSMRRAFLSETQKSFVNCWRCQNAATVLRASRDEVNRRPYEHKIEPTKALFLNFGAHRAPLLWVEFTASVCCEDFGMPRVNALGRLSCRARRSQPALKREMRTSATVKEKVFPAEPTKEAAFRSETAKDSEWGK